MTRVCDFLFSFFGLIFLFPLLIIVTIAGYFDTGSPIFMQTRMGRNKKPFTLIKFRTMRVDTQTVASHLANSTSITRLGGLLRKTKIDELPQLINVLKGDMSIVGPRPNLMTQDELIRERDTLGVYEVLPGITGLAQLSNIDMSTPVLLASTDKSMIVEMNLSRYFQLIIRTAIGKGFGDAIK
ncbi:sugar transferase [Vibrio breoganii]|uniref:sugar transferase n=1 Tax=Vibrio breoganii TaxID=553239 RepID=UPI000C851411|nr:sugar transferase [Vibrio breoganii]PMM15180.1 lipid carrier--UDP-N-acetylgalactosaminyltransferase [Vibrio breoganii]